MPVAFITGGNGFVAGHLTQYLLDNTDWKINLFVRWQEPIDNIKSFVQNINNREGVFLHYGDLTDAHSVRFAISACSPDYIFHLGAQSFPKTSFSCPEETLRTNIIGTLNVLEVAREICPASLIHVCSSSEIFGRVSREKLPINEDCSFHPASPYAISKVGTDLLGGFYAEAYKMNVLRTRMFSHTGPGRSDVFAESSFAKQIAMIEAGLQEPVLKTGNLQSLRTWADVRDAVRAYHLLLTRNPQPGAYYNIGGMHTLSVGGMLQTLLSFSTHKDIEIVTDPERLRPIDADLQVPDCNKFKMHTGWTPEIPFEQTMMDLLNYWRAQVKMKGAFLNR